MYGAELAKEIDESREVVEAIWYVQPYVGHSPVYGVFVSVKVLVVPKFKVNAWFRGDVY